MYLRFHDYLTLIEESNLLSIIDKRDDLRIDAELVAQEELISYLKQKYDVATEFKDIAIYDLTSTYNANQLVYLHAPDYDPLKTYSLNTIVKYLEHIYYCSTAISIAEVWNPAHWTLLGFEHQLFFTIFPYPLFHYYRHYPQGTKVYWNNKVYIAAMDTATIFPDDVKYGVQYWGTGVTYTVPAASLGNATYWIKGDNRSKKLVSICCEVALYHLLKRVAPANVPDIRVKAYDDAIDWLKGCAMGKFSPNIPLIEEYKKGLRIRYGGRECRNINSY